MAHANIVGLRIPLEIFSNYVDVTDEDLDDYEKAFVLQNHFAEQLKEAHLRSVQEAINPNAAFCEHPTYPNQTGVSSSEIPYLSHFYIDYIDDEVKGYFFIFLSSRYTPIYLDYKNPHGGIYPYLVIDEDFHTKVKIAKDNISPFFPEVQDLELVVFNAWF